MAGSSPKQSCAMRPRLAPHKKLTSNAGALVAAVLFVAAASTAGAVDNPTVTEPIADNAGLRGHALWDSWYDLSDIGYMEEEYFVSGNARTSPTEPATTAFTTRIIVTRPINPADFNGTVMFDWVNVTAQFENAVDTLEAHELLHRHGYAYVHVSAQSAGVCCTPLTPKIWDPIRYASLSHPGDTYSFDMFSQVVQAVKFPQGIDPMGGLEVEVALAAGQSQSASRLDSYVRQWQPSHGVIDGFLIHGGGSKTYNPPPEAPVIHLLSDAEAATAEPSTSVNYTLWEIAGTAHSDFWIGYHQVNGQGPRATADLAKQPASADDDMHVVAGNYGEQIHPNQATCLIGGGTMPMRHSTSAAIHYLDRWVRTGERPPEGPRYQFSSGALARDQHGNALGGIRLPPIDVPVARYVSTACALGGITVPFTEAELALLYPNHAAYVCQMQERTDAAVAAGFVLPEDSTDLMNRVAAASNRWVIAGGPGCGDCGNGALDAGEECDDANAVSGDGCSAFCAIEACHTCVGTPSICAPQVGAACDDGNACTTGDQCDINAACAGVVDLGAACDDGNACTGPDACDVNASCTGAPDVGAACDDNNVCTSTDTCDVNGNCVGGGPLGGCLVPDASARASLKLRDRPAPNNEKDSLSWRWRPGTSDKAQFGDPTQATGYTLCISDGADRLLMANDVPAGAGWTESNSGFSYKDSTLANDGIGRVQLREGAGKAKIKVGGKGANLDMTALGTLELPLVVQLTNGTMCWEAVYENNVTKNTPEQFKAKAN